MTLSVFFICFMVSGYTLAVLFNFPHLDKIFSFIGVVLLMAGWAMALRTIFGS